MLKRSNFDVGLAAGAYSTGSTYQEHNIYRLQLIEHCFGEKTVGDWARCVFINTCNHLPCIGNWWMGSEHAACDVKSV